MDRDRYYVGQTIQIDLILDDDITGAGTVQIKYRLPSGTAGAWTATVVDAESGRIRYILPAASNTEAGDTALWAYVIQADATVDIGRTLTLHIEAEGY